MFVYIHIYNMYEYTHTHGSSNCYITLRGEGGEFGPCALDRSDAHSAVPGVGVLAAGGTDVFDIVALNVEPLHSIVVSHDMSGAAPSWHLGTVTVRRHRTANAEPKTWRFEWHNWVGPPQGTAASAPTSVTIFPELINRQQAATYASAKTHTPQSGRSRVTAAPTGKAHGAGGGGGGGAESGGNAMTINKTAISEACQSMVTALHQLHLPSSASPDSGLLRIARLLGAGSRGGGGAGSLSSSNLQIPGACRNLSVLLLGPRQVCTELVEWYGGTSMGDTGLSTKARFTLVKALPPVRAHQPSYTLGEQAKGLLGPFGAMADFVPALLGSLAVSEVENSNGRMGQVDLLHPPVLQGTAPAGAAPSLVQVLLPLLPLACASSSSSRLWYMYL